MSWFVLWSLLLLATWARGQDDADRLLTSVRQPVILEANLPSISVGFKTGPNIPGTRFAIKCVLEGEGCDAPAQGQSVIGSLPVKPAAVEGTVEGLDVDQTYSCFVETALSEDAKVSYCQEAKPFSGVVRFELIFSAYTAADFGPPEQAQVCANVLSLQPGGTCSVLRVTDGSAIVLIQTEYDDYRNAWSLTEALVQDDTEVTAALTSGLEGPVEIADIQTEPPIPSPLSPTGVTANPSTDCVPSVTVAWQAPERSSTITGYFVSCESSTAPTVTSTVAATKRSATVLVEAGESYTCSVTSQGPSGTSVPADASSPVTYSYPGDCPLSPPTDVVASASTSCTPGITVDWAAPTEAPLPEGYTVTCTSGDLDPLEDTAASDGRSITFDVLTVGAAYSCQVVSVRQQAASQPAVASNTATYSFPTLCTFEVTSLVSTDEYKESDPSTWSKYLTGDATISLTASPPGAGPSSAIEFITTCNNNDRSNAGADYSGGLFGGMLFKDFLKDFVEISYMWYKEDRSSSDCSPSTFATTAVKLKVFSQAAKDAGNSVYEAVFTLEPYLNSGGAPETGTWVDETSTKDTGTGLPIENPANVASRGWWANEQFGQCTGTGSDFEGNCRASFSAWYTFLTTNQETFMSDAIITYVALQVGSFNRVVTSYANDLKISSGDYAWTYKFVAQ